MIMWESTKSRSEGAAFVFPERREEGMSHNVRYCKRQNAACPCLSCVYDKRVDNPKTDSKCCDLIGHRSCCAEEEPCSDYEPEGCKTNAER